jgi:hypothetical protein
MALESLLYVSESKIAPSEAENTLGRILATAHAANPEVGITGALLFTGKHFAQVLEGETAAVDETIASITRDPRHGQLSIVAREPLAERRFPDWSMAYSGPSQFVSRHVTRLLNAPTHAESRRAAEWLAELLDEFSAQRDVVA